MNEDTQNTQEAPDSGGPVEIRMLADLENKMLAVEFAKAVKALGFTLEAAKQFRDGISKQIDILESGVPPVPPAPAAPTVVDAPAI